MSLLMGLGKGLQGAGQAIGQGLYAYAMAMRDDERERMRQASLEKRWAKEDARYAEQQAKDDQRYQARESKDDARYQDSVKFREQDANRANARESRQDEKQSAAMLGQALERLDSIKKDKAKQIAEMFIDPMTKQVIDQEAYSKAMADLNSSYLEDASKMVQQSGMSEAQINKYGFGMFLPEPTAGTDTGTDKTTTEIVTPPPEGDYDKAKWATDLRKAKASSGNSNDKNSLTYAIFGNGLMGEDAGTIGQRFEQYGNQFNNRNNGHYTEEQARQHQLQTGVPDYSYPPIGTGLPGKIAR